MKKQRLILILLLIVIVPIGFATKFYSGPAQTWVNDSLGGLFYEVFWCLFIALLFPAGRPLIIAFWVFIITCILEFMQLWHPPFLEVLRSNFIGRTLLGNSFNTADFIYYAIGCILGWYTLVLVKKASGISLNTSD